MTPILFELLLLLALTLTLAVVGMVLARQRTIRIRNASSYTRLAAALVLLAAYAMDFYAWPGVHLRSVDFWSAMVILGFAAYALVWAALAYQLNKGQHEEFGESFMLSMLYSDSEAAHIESQDGAKPAPPTAKRR